MNFIKGIKNIFNNFYIKDIELILNAILVNENIRPAMLVQVQQIGYNETKGTDKLTLRLVNKIKKIFPNLYLTDDYHIYQGIIISKEKLSFDNKSVSLEKMGEILGYPCYKNFQNFNRDGDLFTLSLIVSYNNIEVTLLANVCENNETLNKFKFNLIAQKAFDVFTNDKYKHILKGINIDKVYVKIEKNITTQSIIDKLITNKKITEGEKEEIINILYNSGFSYNLIEYDFQYNNKIHKSILLDILLKQKYNTLSPFYPLTSYPIQNEAIDRITIQLEKALIEILNKTKNK